MAQVFSRASAHGARRRAPRGSYLVPGDKAISHRALLLAACAQGDSLIEGFSPAGDCQATARLVRALGCRVGRRGDAVTVTGLASGTGRRRELQQVTCARSGTTMRLGAGLLAGLPLSCRLTGHSQLLRRPMGRIVVPLRLMGARVQAAPGDRPPLELTGGGLRGIEFTPPQASAQVKSALLLAGLSASSPTRVHEPIPTRDHTERLLAAMGAQLTISETETGNWLELRPGPLQPLRLRVPGDPSTAAVLATAAALVPGSDIRLRQVSLNPTRLGFFAVLRRMGAEVDLEGDVSGPEPAGDIRVRQAPLGAFSIGAAEVPRLIDELPLLGLLATVAEGVSEVRGAAELRVKESDRIAGLVQGLRALGADIQELPDGFSVRGPTRLRSGRCDARSDHRLAMTFTLAELASSGPVQVDSTTLVGDSFPGFFQFWEALR
ncbi:MAG: 3-phosphoshikimate 1-carboxyvinyltransferase [Candidatus Dormibacteria bacterium]